ncbi:hypothetical protein SAMN04487963_2514 [Marinobacter zhejiangensis]|uniref:Oligosaccharide repeat unit polymerase n=2 Tax=Marinobacter zhejiangensis TaxID=488535 RepID=A0A1I4QR47_9GAMM|nr:hypothetical protein SAMN04487963_2514 [Marinobacter zhejiangensis]
MSIHSFSFFLALLLFKASLDAAYYLVLAPHFSAFGYTLSLDPIRYSLSWVLYIPSFLVLNSRFKLVRDYVFVTIILGLWAPLMTVWGMDEARPLFPILVSGIAYLVVYLSMIFFDKALPLKIPILKGGRRIAFLLSVMLTIFLVFWYLYRGVGLNLDLSKVYEFRRVNEELAAFGFFAYLNNWIYKVFAVYALSYLLLKRNVLAAGVVVLVFVFYFAANAHKSVLFSPVLVVLIWLYFRRYSSMLFIPLGFSTIVLFSIATFFILGDVWVSALFPSRVFILPAHLTFLYFDFFENNEFIFYSNSFLSYFVDYPYNVGLASLMGEHWGRPDSAANNGYVSSAYAQAGVSAVVIYSVFIGAFISLLDRLVKKGEIMPWFALAIMIIPIRDFLISMDLLTAFLTGGMLWATVLLVMARRKAV